MFFFFFFCDNHNAVPCFQGEHSTAQLTGCEEVGYLDVRVAVKVGAGNSTQQDTRQGSKHDTMQ